MSKANSSGTQGNVLWVYPDSLQRSLDAATWLETTRELRQLGWQVTLVAEGPTGVKQIAGVAVYSIPKPNVYLVRQVIFHLRVLALLLRLWSSLDVILFHQMSAPWLLPLRLLRAFGGRSRPLLIMDTRTVPMIPTEVATRKDRLRNWFDNTMNRIANRWADGQTAITPRMAETVGIPPRQLLGVWPSGVTVERFAPARDTRRWPEAGEAVELVYVGALHHQRNLLNLCHAVLEANRSEPRFRFTMVGDGTARRALEQLASENTGVLLVLPPVPHADIPPILAAAHVGVLPFPDQERFRVSSPIKLFEYMAAGLPIMATRIACHTDVVSKGSYAYWAESADVAGLRDALEEIWSDRQMLAERGRVAAEAAPDWSWAAAAVKLSAALNRRLAQPAAVSPSVSPQNTV